MATRKDLVQTSMTTPLDTLLYSAGPAGWDIDSDARAGTAVIKAGMMVYNDATTNSNDYTECAAAHGTTSTQGEICYVNIQADTKYLTGDFNKTDAYADGDPIEIVHLQLFNRVWARMTSASYTAAQIVICAAAGVLAAVTSGAGAAIDVAVHAFKVLKAGTSVTWALVEYMGKIAVDNS